MPILVEQSVVLAPRDGDRERALVQQGPGVAARQALGGVEVERFRARIARLVALHGGLEEGGEGLFVPC